MNTLKERIKTFILLLLILTSIVLAAVIWSGDQISGLFSVFSEEKEPERLDPTEAAEVFFCVPERIVVHLDGKKILLSEGQMYYDPLWRQIRESIRIFLSNAEKTAVVVSDQVWKNACSEDSIFLDYSSQYTTEFFSRIYATEYKTDGYDFSQLLIRFPSGTSKQYTFLLRSEDSGAIYQFHVSDPQLSLAQSVAALQQLSGEGSLVFSFEVNFDQKAESAAAQNVLIDSMVLLELEASNYNTYRAQNPLANDSGELNEELVRDVAALFQANAQTMRKYVDKNGSITFVENYATLKIHSDGLIEYQVTDETAAPPLAGEGSPAVLAAEFIGDVLKLTGGHAELLLRSGISRESADGNSVFGFDYRIDSSPVLLKANGAEQTAIALEIRDDKLISYRHYLRSYESRGETVELPASIAVIDEALQEQTSVEIPFVDRMYAAYLDDGAGAAEPSWFVHFREEEQSE